MPFSFAAEFIKGPETPFPQAVKVSGRQACEEAPVTAKPLISANAEFRSQCLPSPPQTRFLGIVQSTQRGWLFCTMTPDTLWLRLSFGVELQLGQKHSRGVDVVWGWRQWLKSTESCAKVSFQHRLPPFSIVCVCVHTSLCGLAVRQVWEVLETMQRAANEPVCQRRK